MTRRVLIVLALLVGAWFAYGSLAGRKAEATSREPGGGLQDLDALTHVIPAKPAEAAKAPAVPSEGPAALHPKVAELEQNVAQGNRREAIAGALSLAAAQSAEPQFRRLTARTAKMALLAGDPEGAAGVTTALWDNWTMGSLPWPESAPEWDEHQALLRETMSGLLFNPGVAWRSRTYEVSKNDTLDKIRRRVKAKEGIWVESGFLSAVNRVSPTRLQEGQ